MDAKKLADHIAREIFRCGDESKHPATRIQYKSRKADSDGEWDGGGFIEPALARFIESVIANYSDLSAQPPVDTALRYIRNAEHRDNGPCSTATKGDSHET